MTLPDGVQMAPSISSAASFSQHPGLPGLWLGTELQLEFVQLFCNILSEVY